MIQHLRWQVLIALVGVLLLLTMLGQLATTLDTVLLPESGGTYTEGLIGRPTNLNPLFVQSRADQDIAALLFNSLARADATGVLQPELATRWVSSEEGQRYTFYLRRDVLWHDGAPFTAEDVAFTIGVIQDPAYARDPAASELWREVTVEIVDAHTIRFILPDDLAPFAPFLSSTTFPILPQHLLGALPVESLPTAPFSQQPIGTGPWRLASVQPEEVVLEPHPTYFGPDPLLDRLVFHFYDDASSALQAYRQGEVLGMAQVRPEDLGSVVTDPSLNLQAAPLSGYTALFFNLRLPLFQSQPLREALLRALDRPALVQQVLNGQAIVADTFLLPTHWAYNPELPRYSFTPDEASLLLEQEGWDDNDGDGVLDKEVAPLRFTLLVDEGNPQLVQMALAVVSQWRAVGIEVEALIVPSNEVAEALASREFDSVLLTTPLSGLPADPDFYPLWHSSQAEGDGKNYTSFRSEAADQLLVEARHTLDPEVRRTLYQEFQALLAVQLPALPLYHPIYNYGLSTEVRNVQLAPLTRPADRFQSLGQWSLRSKRLLIERGAATPTPAR